MYHVIIQKLMQFMLVASFSCVFCNSALSQKELSDAQVDAIPAFNPMLDPTEPAPVQQEMSRGYF